MRIEVVGKDLPVTDAIRQHAEAKSEKLLKFFDGVQQITYTISRPDHSNHGAFHVELIVDVVKHEDFVSRATADDLYAAIDQAVQKGARQLSDFKERLRTNNR